MGRVINYQILIFGSSIPYPLKLSTLSMGSFSTVNKICEYVSFIGDFSKFTWLFPMSYKYEAHTIFLRFQTQVEKFFRRHKKVVRSN